MINSPAFAKSLVEMFSVLLGELRPKQFNNFDVVSVRFPTLQRKHLPVEDGLAVLAQR